MLIGIIHKNNTDDYYVNLDKKGNVNELSITHVNELGVRGLSKKEALDLLKYFFFSKLTFIENLDGYDIYLDEAKNKRFFKNGKEDISLFLNSNGHDALRYLEKIEKKLPPASVKHLKLIKGLIVVNIIMSVMDVPLLIAVTGNSRSPIIYNEITTGFYKKLDIEDCKNLVYNSPYLDSKEKDILYNEDVYKFILAYSDSNMRNYQLTKKITNLDIIYFGPEDIKDGEKINGYYNELEPSIVHMRKELDPDTYEYLGVLIHEYMHLLQRDHQYNYIQECHAEMMCKEFYGIDNGVYKEAIKRTEVLMEIIGPEPVIKGNYSNIKYFEDALGEYLDEEDKERLLELFKTPGLELDNKEVNSEIDKLLAKMYFNKTGKDIKDDKMINEIYSNLNISRLYFNSNKPEYYRNYLVSTDRVDLGEISMEEALTYNIESYMWYQPEIIVKDDKTMLNTKLTKTKDFTEIKPSSDDWLIINFEDGSTGYTRYDPARKKWSDVDHYRFDEVYEPSIYEKFSSEHARLNSKNDLYTKNPENTESEAKLI